jgi:hypothetical protein
MEAKSEVTDSIVAAVIAKEPLHAGDVIDVSVPQSITITHG